MTSNNNSAISKVPFWTALDFDDLQKFEEMVKLVKPYSNYFKIGMEATTKFGAPSLVQKLKDLGCIVFLDLKFHDIPNTVGGAVKSASEIGADYVTVHSTTGQKSLEEAVKNANDVKLLGISVLTSISDQECQQIYGKTASEKVLEQAKILKNVGFYGMVCSAQEAQMIRSDSDLDDLKLITPGIRPTFAQKGDQSRVMTPAEAVRAGVDYMVIGRPITESKNPAEAARMILEDMGI